MPKNPTPRTPKKNGLFIYSNFVKRKGRVIREYRWHIYKQGRIIGASTEGYSRINSIKSNLRSIATSLGNHFTSHEFSDFYYVIQDAFAEYKSKK